MFCLSRNFLNNIMWCCYTKIILVYIVHLANKDDSDPDIKAISVAVCSSLGFLESDLVLAWQQKSPSCASGWACSPPARPVRSSHSASVEETALQWVWKEKDAGGGGLCFVHTHLTLHALGSASAG